MAKTRQIIIRISDEQYKFIKEMDGSFSQIWEIGFDDWSRDFPEFLKEKAKEYDKMYKQCIYKMQKCINNVYTKNRDLEQLLKEYVETGRSLDNPSTLDKNWLSARLTKIKGVSMKRFFEYANGKVNDDKQQLLGGIYQ
jgi:hypothetical protein